MSVNSKKLTYLSLDSMAEGVGASQVYEYLKKLAPNFHTTLVSFEKDEPSPSLLQEFVNSGIDWRPIPYGKTGINGAIKRIIKLFRIVPRKGLIHARSDFCSFIAILKGNRSVIWDCRALMSDHRKAIGQAGFLHLSYFLFRVMEFVSANFSREIIVITNAVVPVISSRYKLSPEKFHVIPTCVNLGKFQMESPLVSDEISVLIAGTVGPAYDFELMNQILMRLKEVSKIHVTLALGKSAYKKSVNFIYHDQVVTRSHEQMPALIAEHTIGFAIWKNDLGICLKSVAATKVAEFLAVGRPVVVNSLQGDMSNIIGDAGVGILTEGASPEDVNSYVEQILVLIRTANLAQNCRSVAEAHFSLDSATAKLSDIYNSILYDFQ